VLVELLVLLEVVVEVDVVVGMTIGSGSPQWASEQVGFFPGPFYDPRLACSAL
jgi:hypothetical protein